VIVRNVLVIIAGSGGLVLHRSKIPLVLTTKVTHLRSLLFRQKMDLIQQC